MVWEGWMGGRRLLVLRMGGMEMGGWGWRILRGMVVVGEDDGGGGGN